MESPEIKFCQSVIQGKASDVEFYLTHYNLDVNSLLPCEMRPLTVALNVKSVEVVKVLLEAGANVDLPDTGSTNPILWDALFNATEVEQPGQLGILLDAGLPIDHIDERGLTLLMQAAWTSIWLTRYLLERGADPNITTRDGWTAIMFAVSDSSALDTESILAIVRLLISSGADRNVRNASGHTAADVTQRANHHTEEETLILGVLRGPPIGGDGR